MAGVAGMGSLAVPAIGVIVAWIQIGETPEIAELLGILLIGAALALLAVTGTRQIVT